MVVAIVVVTRSFVRSFSLLLLLLFLFLFWINEFEYNNIIICRPNEWKDTTDDRATHNRRNLNNYYSMSAHFATAVFCQACVCEYVSHSILIIFLTLCVWEYAHVCDRLFLISRVLNWNDVKLYLSKNTKSISACAHSLLTFKVMLILARILHTFEGNSKSNSSSRQQQRQHYHPEKILPVHKNRKQKQQNE